MLLSLQMKVKSGPLAKFREERGLNQKDAAEICGVSVGVWGNLENMRFDGVSVDSAAKVADAIECPIEEIMPQEARGKDLRFERRMYRAASPLSLDSLSGPERRMLVCEKTETQEKIEREDIAKAIDRAMKLLTFREREVLKMRYGIGDENGRILTLEEIGKTLRVTKERVRQVEGRAIRKLQSPASIRRIESFVGACVE